MSLKEKYQKCFIRPIEKTFTYFLVNAALYGYKEKVYLKGIIHLARTQKFPKNYYFIPTLLCTRVYVRIRGYANLLFRKILHK